MSNEMDERPGTEEMSPLTRVCVCGHVAESNKGLIEGKRYSGYRAEIYSRLEIRRILYENLKETNIIPRKHKSEDKQGSVTKSRTKKRQRRPRSSSSRLINSWRVVKRHHLPKINFEKLPKDEQDKTEESENWYNETQFDLSAALAEINKKLSSQSMFWVNLSATMEMSK